MYICILQYYTCQYMIMWKYMRVCDCMCIYIYMIWYDMGISPIHLKMDRRWQKVLKHMFAVPVCSPANAIRLKIGRSCAAENDFKISILRISPFRAFSHVLAPSEVPPSVPSAPSGRRKMGTGKQHTRSSRLGICVDTLRSGRPDPYPTCNHWCLHSVDWIQGNSNMTYMTSWTVTCPENTAFLSFWIRSNLQLAVQWLAVAREISTIRFRAVAFPPLPSAWSQHVTTHCLELFLWGVTQQTFHIFSPSKNCPKSAQQLQNDPLPCLSVWCFISLARSIHVKNSVHAVDSQGVGSLAV
jgi:hypothetical protein